MKTNSIFGVCTFALLAGSTSVYAQGKVDFFDYPGGIGIQIYTAQPLSGDNTTVTFNGYTGMEAIGQNNNTTGYNYSSGPMPGFTGQPLGPGYSVELLVGPASATGTGNYDQLQETGQISTLWNSGSPVTGAGGFWKSTSFINVPYPAQTTLAVAVGAWFNNNGAITTLVQAQASGQDWGLSNIGSVRTGSNIITPGIPTGLNNFSLVTLPEPSTIALGFIGASALLFRRRL